MDMSETATTSTTTATTAYGFDRMVTALHMGNGGYRTGATSRPGGQAHLAMKATKETACGRTIKSSYVKIVPLHGLNGEEWADRMVTCKTCRKSMNV